MRATNLTVRKFLLENNYDEIWFKPHGNRSDYVFTQNGNYLATDLWNLFDGMCFTEFGGLIFLQMKTNAWPKEKPINDFVKKHPNTKVFVFNVTNKLKESKGKYILKKRFYS